MDEHPLCVHNLPVLRGRISVIERRSSSNVLMSELCEDLFGIELPETDILSFFLPTWMQCVVSYSFLFATDVILFHELLIVAVNLNRIRRGCNYEDTVCGRNGT